MQIFLDEIAGRYTHENITIILDGASWHKSLEIIWSDNMKPHFLSPCSPELNPQEHLWDELREKHFHNKSFENIKALKTNLIYALRSLENDSDRVKSITAWEWIINHLKN